MAKVNTNINIEQNLKREAQELFSYLGMDMTTAIGLFLRQAVEEQRIPFEIKRETLNETSMAAIGEYYSMKNNPAEYRRYSNFNEVVEDVLR